MCDGTEDVKIHNEDDEVVGEKEENSSGGEEKGEEEEEAFDKYTITHDRLTRHIMEQVNLVTNEESRIRRWISSCEDLPPKRMKTRH